MTKFERRRTRQGMISPLSFDGKTLNLLDQRRLPSEKVILACTNIEMVAEAIETLAVRGAPAIGVAAAYALALDALSQPPSRTWADYMPDFLGASERLKRTRPTAVNLAHALSLLGNLAKTLDPQDRAETFSRVFLEGARGLENLDNETCRKISSHGASLIPAGEKVRVITHCNAGSLATAGMGTAVGVIRALHAQGSLEHVFVDETRPLLQGARLTAFELKESGIPFTLIIDSVAAVVMQQKKADWVVVGADRIAANGDSANKVGSYGLSVQARYHGLKFFVAAPLSTVDISIPNGPAIPIEERSEEEVTHLYTQRTAPTDVRAFNPAFDVIPHELIAGIITEKGVARAPFEPTLRKWTS